MITGLYIALLEMVVIERGRSYGYRDFLKCLFVRWSVLCSLYCSESSPAWLLGPPYLIYFAKVKSSNV
jgi:hypothetical protein